LLVHVFIAYSTSFIGSRRIKQAASNNDSINTDVMTVKELKLAVRKIIGKDMAEKSYKNFFQGLNDDSNDDSKVSTPIIQFTERLLAGSIGSSSARAVITALLKSKGLALNDIVGLLDETSQAIQFHRRLTDATLDSISQGVSVVDSNLRLVAWNKQYLELLNYPEGMVYKGMPIEELIRFNASRGLLGKRNIAREVEKRLIYLRKGSHYRHERSYENSRYLQIEGNPMPDDCYVTNYTDVSHYKQIEQKLLKSDKDVRFYTDNAPAMLAYVDNQFILKFANKAYLEFFSSESGKFLGENINSIHSETEFNKRKPYLVAALQGEPQSFELELENKHNIMHFVLGTYVPDVDKESSKVNGVFVIIQDISTRRKAELELERAKENLEQRVNERTLEIVQTNKELEVAKQKAETANQSKTKFIADASHDLLQPFNAARLFSSLLTEQTNQLPEDIKQTVMSLDQSLRSAENLLGALLDIAKIDAGGITIDKSDFPVNQLFDHLQNQYHSLAKSKALKFKVRKTKYYTNSDQKLLYRVLQNLTNNALKYTESGGVLVACRKIQDQLKIYVIDTGVGLNEKEQEIIFHDFLRLHNVSSKQEPGLGLGLSIVDRIINQLGHDLSIDSIPGKGSSFCLSLPFVNKQADERISTIKEPVIESIKQPILCIDNEAQILEGMKQLIGNWGHDVECANGSKQALLQFEQGLRPAILLVDYHLDDETGLEVIDQIFSQYNYQCPVVIITANRTEELKRIVNQKNYKILLKPIKPAALRTLINQINM
jgi:PAS domain S-box-containing protein